MKSLLYFTGNSCEEYSRDFFIKNKKGKMYEDKKKD